jgi:hypothetical protein
MRAGPKVLAVAPDPLTTAAGRVVDVRGNPVAGARVTCLARRRRAAPTAASRSRAVHRGRSLRLRQ